MKNLTSLVAMHNAATALAFASADPSTLSSMQARVRGWLSPLAPKVNKHKALLAALAVPANRVELMSASGFDDKNLSVAMCNLKRLGHVIKIEIQDGVRIYSTVTIH